LTGRVAVLVNPVAGRGRAAAAGRAAIARLRQLGAEVRELEGASAAEARELVGAALADRPDALVVVGGDGTLAAILDELVGTEVPVALVPAGTGNDLARSLGLPSGGTESAAHAAELALSGRIRDIDVGEIDIGGRRTKFLTIAALGFDAHVADRTNRLRRPRGRACYYLALVIELVRLRPMRFSLRVDGGPPEHRPGILVAIGNTRSYGGGMPMCPEADPRDGRFDVTHVAPIGRLKLLRLFPSLLKGRHLSRPEVGALRTALIEVSAPGLVVYADGERIGAGPARFAVLPRALRLRVPG